MDEKTLTSTIPYASILAYDLSPEGTKLALFVVSSEYFQFPAPSWVIVVNATNSEILKQVRFGTYPEFLQGYAPQIAFTPDGKFLVVLDQQKVTVLDSATLLRLRTIKRPTSKKFNVPAEMLVADNSDIAAISFGTGASRLGEGRWPVRTDVIDVSTGEKLAGWDDDDIPLSISPRGDFVAIPNHESAGPVMGVKVVDPKSGRSVASLSGGYPGRTPGYPNWKGQFWTGIIAKFISDDEVVLTPDGNYDQSGHALARDVKIVGVRNDQVIQEIAPENFGPTGEIAVSADQSAFVAISRYLAPEYLIHHWRIPSGTRPELLVFSRQKQQTFNLVDRTKLPELLGLRMRGQFDKSGLRISRDGSVVSVAEEYGVTVLVSVVSEN